MKELIAANCQATAAAEPVSNHLVACARPLVLAVLSALLWAGCPATGDEVRPPNDQFFFPTGMDMAPRENVMFVANANSDLRYDSGAIVVVSLSKVDDIVEEWLTGAAVPAERDCEIDLRLPYTLVCNEREVVLSRAAARIGNFATELKIQELDDDGALRVFAAVRGDPSLTWMDWDGRDLACGGSGEFPECDDDHRLTQIRNDSDLPGLPSEPFGLFVDSENQYAVLTHLSSGAVSLADAPRDGSPPVISDALGNLFAPDPLTGIRGAVGIAGRSPGAAGDRLYVTSRTESRVQTLFVSRPPGGFPVLVPAEYFFLNRILPSSNSRGIAFSADGDRGYVVNRNPPMLHVIDTSVDQLGVPRNELKAGVEICTQASNLTVADFGRGERIYVACFSQGQVWSVDPLGGVVDAIIDVGRGPHAVIASQQREKLYVSNFLEDTVAVIDMAGGSTTENRVVLRLGRTRKSGGN